MRQLVRRGAILAGRLREAFGLAPGDRVALVMKNVPEYVELLLAGWYAGLTMVPANAKLHPRELEYILGHSGARVAFVTSDLIDAVGPLEASVDTLERIVEVGSAEYRRLLEGDPAPMTEVAPDDVAWLFYTSGTTGRPKGAMLSHRNLLAMTLSYFADVDRIAPGDAILHAAPLSHGSGCYVLPHAAQAACQVIPASGGFDPAEIFDLFQAHPGTTMFAAPTMVKRLAEHPGAARSDHPGLKTIVYGGGPMYLADLDRAHDVFGHRLAQIYGQGESPMCITALDKRAPRRYRAPAPSRAPRLGRHGAAGGRGHGRGRATIGRCRGRARRGAGARRQRDARATGSNPEASAETLRGGWLHTGDVGSIDADGFLTLRDRSKDLIISGGANIYPREVEEVLLRHPAVAEVSVIGAPDPKWGETVVAFVVVADGPARRRRRPRRPLPRPDRPLQAAQGLPLRRRPAQEQLRQGAEDGAARPPGCGTALSAWRPAGPRAGRQKRA